MVNILLSRNFIYEDLKNYIKPDSKIAVLFFSFNESAVLDDESFKEVYPSAFAESISYFNSKFGNFGVNSNNICYINLLNDDEKAMKLKIKDSSILFIPYGIPNLLVSRIFDKNLVRLIQEYNKTVIGVSAGALIQMDKYFCIPDAYYKRYEYFSGLGLLKDDFYISVHFNSPSKELIIELNEISNNLGKVIYALDDNSSIIIDNEKIFLNGNISKFFPN